MGNQIKLFGLTWGLILPQLTSMKLQPNDYPNIIFDLGGVILNIDYGRTATAFQQLGAVAFDKEYTQAAQSDIFDAFERGELEEPAFRNGLRQQLGLSVTDSELDHAWNAMLLDLPTERLTLLSKLKGNRRTFLLSNTNQIHVRSFEKTIKDVHGINDLSSLFEQTYYSCEVGMRKPEERIFQMVFDRHGLDPKETLFIDDSYQHIEGARKAGLNAYHLSSGETILDLFGHIS